MENPFHPDLLVERRGAVRLVTFNRPEALNAVNAPVHAALAQVWRVLADDPGARAVVVTGRGRAFSAGGDLGHIVELQQDPDMRRRELAEARLIVTEMIGCPLPIIAAVNGPAVGLGCSVALLCDLVYIG